MNIHFSLRNIIRFSITFKRKTKLLDQMTLQFKPIWFDSMGAKSSCTFVKTPDVSILIDPGASEMQPSFPANEEQKIKWYIAAVQKIKNECKKVDCICISHYHYDHYFPQDLEVYGGKKVFLKNPNEYINSTQRSRAEDFFQQINKYFNLDDSEELVKNRSQKTYGNPLDDLPLALKKDFKSYNSRRKEVLSKGKKRFDKQVSKWITYKPLSEKYHKKTQFIFPENNTYTFKDTTIRFTGPLFHGIEFATVGWVYGLTIEYKDKKLFYSSDLSGPMIEDYADMIIKENPSILILDGPTTYLFGYILNRINLQRTIDNTIRIIKEINSDVIIYDHHLTREARFRDRTKKVWETAKKTGKKIQTAAEYLGEKTVVELDK
jgi:predicted metallo-beta-lactamase superfamily hydrolase